MARRARRAVAAPIAVTSRNFGGLLVESLGEAVEIHEGRAAPARVHSYPAVTARDVEVQAPPVFSAQQIRAIREQLGLSQDVFARVLNVSPATDRSWEQRQREPDGAALRLLQIAERHPEILRQFVRRAAGKQEPRGIKHRTSRSRKLTVKTAKGRPRR